MGFFFIVTKIPKILFHLTVTLGYLFAQTKPDWTNTQKNSIGLGFYYGIGLSRVTSDEADIRAFLEFARNVEVKVKSTFQREVNEEGKDFSEQTHLSMEMISDVSLKGIAITERYNDTLSKTFYSLIQYRMTEYDSLIQFQIGREIALMKIRNKMQEEKRQEELRSEKVMHQQEEDRQKEELRARQEELILEQNRRMQKEKEAELHKKIYGEFLRSARPEKAISFRNGEISNEESSLLLKAGIAPFRFNGGMYALRMAMFEVSATALFRNGKFSQQETYIKVQVLPGVGEFTKTTIALGAVQAIGLIADSGYHFKRSVYSAFIAGNITMPEYAYSTFSFYGDKRKIGIGVTSFPFYEQFKNHLGFVIEVNSVFEHAFRNSKNNSIVVNGGIRLQGSETFSTQLAYEDYEQFNLTFEFQF